MNYFYYETELTNKFYFTSLRYKKLKLSFKILHNIKEICLLKVAVV